MSQVNKADKKRKPSKLESFATAMGIAEGLASGAEKISGMVKGKPTEVDDVIKELPSKKADMWRTKRWKSPLRDKT